MRFLVHYYSRLFVLTMMMGLGACTLSDPESSSQQPALTLQAQQNFSLTNLTWDKVNVTGFKEYIILHSSSPIPDNPVPEINSEITVLKRIDNLETTTLDVSSPLLTPQTCYKLYCAVDDRFLYSANVCIDSQTDVVEGFFDRACHEIGNDTAVLFDRINNQLASLNYKTGTLTNQVTDIVLNFPSMEMSTYNNVTNVFGSDQSPAWLRKYTFPSLNSTNFKEFNDVLWAANVHNQFVFAATNGFNTGFQVLSRNNLVTIDFEKGMPDNQCIAVFPGNPITVLTLGPIQSKKYTIDENGMIINETPITARALQPDRQHNCAEGQTLFITSGNGAVVNANGELLGTINTNVNNFIQLIRLSPDESKAVYIINANNEIRLEIVDLSSLPAITVLQSLVLPIVSYADIIPDEDIIYVIGTSFNSSFPQTIILKFPMPI